MKPILTWITTTLAGVVTLSAYPVFAQERAVETGFHAAQLLVPAGFLVLFGGVAGLFLTWCASPKRAE